MSEENKYVNLSFTLQDSKTKLMDKVSNFIERHKNFNRLSALVTAECSRLCLSNFKADKLNREEVICISTCANKFYDSLEIGDNIFRRMSLREIDLTPLSNGKFEEVINKL